MTQTICENCGHEIKDNDIREWHEKNTREGSQSLIDKWHRLNMFSDAVSTWHKLYKKGCTEEKHTD